MGFFEEVIVSVVGLGRVRALVLEFNPETFVAVLWIPEILARRQVKFYGVDHPYVPGYEEEMHV